MLLLIEDLYAYVNILYQSPDIGQYEGGGLQCVRYRSNGSNYLSEEERAFATSINENRSKMSICLLYIKVGGLRIPNWNLQANIHGFVTKGTIWIGIIDENGKPAVTYNVTCGQIFFIPRNNIHWIKNIGDAEAVVVLYFSTHEEFFTDEIDFVFSLTPEDILTRTLQPEGGVDFIRSFERRNQSIVLNLPSNPTDSITRQYPQSDITLVWKYFYDLEGARKLVYNRAETAWAGFYQNTTGLIENAIVYGNSVFSKLHYPYPDSLSLGVLRILPYGLWLPHYNLNAHEMGYVLRGCGKVGVTNEQTIEFDIGLGDVVYFPIGKQHYIKNTCEEDLILIRAFSISLENITLYTWLYNCNNITIYTRYYSYNNITIYTRYYNCNNITIYTRYYNYNNITIYTRYYNCNNITIYTRYYNCNNITIYTRYYNCNNITIYTRYYNCNNITIYTRYYNCNNITIYTRYNNRNNITIYTRYNNYNNITIYTRYYNCNNITLYTRYYNYNNITIYTRHYNYNNITIYTRYYSCNNITIYTRYYNYNNITIYTRYYNCNNSSINFHLSINTVHNTSH
ncbi:lung adenoma susceptibility 2 isoform X4 [Pelobates cultripes]|uniref:Lung adenoma susceptibility 2 isoform X4 n=1 Tax=Pelobates cultripes TaxID=61616 RepID=A0AAD1SEW6_PELCU|nr:lung adenoma susceptibility 2 isoform X4 [Pelobates cultripes]